jgi:hypothetical protein
MKNKLFIVYFICVALLSCNLGSKEKAKLIFIPVSDSLYKSNDAYKQNLSVWKSYYEKCMQGQLFQNAFYLQLGNKVNIGSINNAHELNVNSGAPLLDTSGNRNIFNLLSIVKWNNCYDTINLNDKLRMDFFGEVVNALNASPAYKSLATIIDAKRMSIKLESIGIDTLMNDSLINLLSTTHDSSLIHFKELLLKPENALLAQAVEVLGFDAEFTVKKKLPMKEEKQLMKGNFFNMNSSNDRIDILLLSNNKLHIKVNKRYTVLGGFLKLEEVQK